MKPHKSPLVISLLGLLLSASVAVAAQQTPQTPAQGDQKKAESCCTGEGMESCCCGSGSCDMMKHEQHNKKGHAADGSCCNMKAKAAKNKTKSKQKAG